MVCLKGVVTFPPYDVIQGRFKISASELSFSQRQRMLGLHRLKFIATGGTYTGSGNYLSLVALSMYLVYSPI